MDLESLANLGEFIGGIVVVISLIYLSLQVRQNTRAQRTQNHAIALDRIAQFQSRMSKTGEFSEIMLLGVTDPALLSRQQRVQFTWAFYEMFGAFEFIYMQHLSGAMPDEVWKRWEATLRWWMSFPGVQTWWAARPSPFSGAFSEFVEALPAAGPPDRAAQRRWASFLRVGAAPSVSPSGASDKDSPAAHAATVAPECDATAGGATAVSAIAEGATAEGVLEDAQGRSTLRQRTPA